MSVVFSDVRNALQALFRSPAPASSTAAPMPEAFGADAAELPELGEEGSRIADWLPYRSYRDTDKLFINRDSLGFVLELRPQTGADQQTADRLKGLYSRLPVHATMQIHLYASPIVAPMLREYAALRRIDSDARERSAPYGRPARNLNTHRQIARRHYAHLQRGSQQPLIDGMGFLIRNFRLAASVTVPGHIQDLRAADQLLDIRDGMRSTFEAARFPNSVWGPEDLIGLVAEMLNPARLRGHTDTPIEYDDLKSIADQCIARDTTGDWRRPTRVTLRTLGGDSDDRDDEDSGVRHGADGSSPSAKSAADDVELRFLSVQRAPKCFALWGMGSLVGDLYQDTLQIPCPFMITMGVVVPDQRAMSTSGIAEKMKADRDAKSDIAALSPGLSEKKEDWAKALKAVEAGGKLVWSYHQIVLFARPGEGQRAESATKDVWRARGFELVADGYIHKTALLQALPMTLSKPFFSDLQRQKRMELRTSGNTINLAPLVAETAGTGTPTLLGVARRGQLTSLDFYDNTEGGKNVAVVGAIGSGKSTLLQAIAAAYASKGALVRVFESGRSFERLTARIGGSFVRFVSDRRICVNPFGLVSDERVIDGERCGGIDDDVAMLQPLLAKMASPNESLDPAIYATLATVIKEEYVARGRAMTVSDIRRRYQTGKLYDDRPIDQRYYDMADMLAPFSVGGPYAHYFEGPPTLDFGNDFLVFELQELSTNPHLRGVVQMILLYQITQEMLEERHRQKIFIMDEAKEALAGNGPDDRILAEFLEKLYLRVRKYNGTAVTATQDVAHYFTSAYGRSIWNQSDFILMGRQSENSIEAVAQGQAIRLDENLRRLLGSIGGGSGHFKEWYIHSPLYRGVIRLILNPSTLLLFSNRAEDNTPIDAYLGEGMDVSSAIERVLADRGIHEAA
jgi:conjugal transfer ATP-binding protein TraC